MFCLAIALIGVVPATVLVSGLRVAIAFTRCGIWRSLSSVVILFIDYLLVTTLVASNAQPLILPGVNDD
ncbi:MAG TPA: hypothetical protein V6D14_09425 [Coleofasciculaceae cyanobacterium]|jgi:hypothetical protein